MYSLFQVALSLLVAAVSAGGYLGAAPYSSYGYAAPAIGGYGYAASPYSYAASPYAYSAPYYGAHSAYVAPYATSYANTYKYAVKSPLAYSGYHAPAVYGAYSPYSSYGAYPYHGSYGGYLR